MLGNGMIKVLFALVTALVVVGCSESQPPASSVVTPISSTATPASPAATPSSPMATPASLVMTPTSPVATPTSPVATPASPAMTEVDTLNVVTTSSIAADWVRNVGGDRIEVFALLPAGADPHTFQPGARDVALVADADVVMVMGLMLEEAWLDELIRNASQDASKVVALGDAVDAIAYAEGGAGHDDHDDEHEDEHDEDHEGHEHEDEHDEDHEGHDHEDEHDEDHEGHDHEDEHDEDHEGHDHEDEHDEDHEGHDHEDEHDEDHEGHDHEDEHDEDHEGHDHEDEHDEDHEGHDHEDEHGHEGHHHGEFDPHFWFDPPRVKLAVNEIASRLAALDAEGAEVYRANALAYNAELDGLHEWVKQQVSVVPQDRRLLVTSHDALQYFAQLYGFKVVGTVFPGLSTEREPSAQEAAELVDVIRDTGAPAIFTENIVSDRLAQRISEEAGVRVVSELYTGSLGAAGSGADNYLDFMRYDVRTIVDALK